jgi:hypothetical protein
MTVTLRRFCSGAAVPVTLAGTARQCGRSRRLLHLVVTPGFQRLKQIRWRTRSS